MYLLESLEASSGVWVCVIVFGLLWISWSMCVLDSICVIESVDFSVMDCDIFSVVNCDDGSVDSWLGGVFRDFIFLILGTFFCNMILFLAYEVY